MRMPTRNPAVRLVTLLLVALTAGCASTGTSGSAAGDENSPTTILIEVRHNRTDAGPATFFIEPASEVRTQLGSLQAGETGTFTFDPGALNRQVRLIGTTAMGQTVVSRAVTVPRGAGLSWDLRNNALLLRR
jgi:hypothetical protein